MVRLTDVTTRRQLIVAAAEKGSPGAREAFGKLVGVYWSPVFEFVKVILGAEEARDLTQDFFTRLFEKNDIRSFVEKNDIRCPLEKNEIGCSRENNHETSSRGRFRFWLRRAAWNHLLRYWKWKRAKKRGGGIPHLSLDDDDLDPETRGCIEPKHNTTSERLVDRRRACELIGRVFDRLRADPAYQYRNHPEYFEALKEFITGDTDELQRETAAKFNKTPGAIRKAVSDLKDRYQKYLDDALAESAGGVEHIEEERRRLSDAVQSDG